MDLHIQQKCAINRASVLAMTERLTRNIVEFFSLELITLDEAKSMLMNVQLLESRELQHPRCTGYKPRDPKTPQTIVLPITQDRQDDIAQFSPEHIDEDNKVQPPQVPPFGPTPKKIG